MMHGQRLVERYVDLTLGAYIRCTKRENCYDTDLASRFGLKAPNQPEWYQSQSYLNNNIERRY
jgi:hypothetical protein